MWLNRNLGKVNHETALSGQRLRPSQAGLSGVALGLQGLTCDCIWYLSSALLCFALLIFADHCYSRPVISAGFCSQILPCLNRSVWVVISIPLNSFSVTVLGAWHSLGYHQGNATFLHYTCVCPPLRHPFLTWTCHHCQGYVKEN